MNITRILTRYFRNIDRQVVNNYIISKFNKVTIINITHKFSKDNLKISGNNLPETKKRKSVRKLENFPS